MDSLLVAWQESVFDLYLSEGKIEPEVMENMRSWEHSGFSVDQSVLLAAGDRSGIERLVQYMVRCLFSLSRLVKVTDTGQVAYKAEKDACQVFPDPQADNLEAGAKRNFQILSPLPRFFHQYVQRLLCLQRAVAGRRVGPHRPPRYGQLPQPPHSNHRHPATVPPALSPFTRRSISRHLSQGTTRQISTKTTWNKQQAGRYNS